jgi:hypothetical protein
MPGRGVSEPEPGAAAGARATRALLAGALALVVSLVVVGGTLAGSAIASRRSAQAAEVAVATRQAEAGRPARPRVEAAATRLAAATRQAAATRPARAAAGQTADARAAGQAGPARTGLVGVVLAVSGDELAVKPRRGPEARVVVEPGTIVRKGRRRVALAEVEAGDRLVVVGRADPQRGLVATIVVVDPPRVFRGGR